jgi:hypothetical protein
MTLALPYSFRNSRRAAMHWLELRSEVIEAEPDVQEFPLGED